MFVAQFAEAQANNPEIGAHLPKAQEDLSPLVVLQLFKEIPDQDCELLWVDADNGRPERLILNSVLVPPVCIRPSVAMDGGSGSNEDDITVKLQEIVQVNFALRAALQKGASLKMVMEDWDFLQIQVAQLANGDTPDSSSRPEPRAASEDCASASRASRVASVVTCRASVWTFPVVPSFRPTRTCALIKWASPSMWPRR